MSVVCSVWQPSYVRGSGRPCLTHRAPDNLTGSDSPKWVGEGLGAAVRGASRRGEAISQGRRHRGYHPQVLRAMALRLDGAERVHQNTACWALPLGF